MSLMSKLRAPILGVMLGAAALGISNGCTTITPWRTVSVEERQIGKEKRFTENLGKKNIETREFFISDPYIEGEGYKTKITESLKEATYDLKEEKIIKTVQTNSVEQREQRTEVLGPILFGSLTVAGGVGGVVVGNNIEEGPTGKILGGLVGILGGALLGLWLGEKAPAFTKTESRRDTGVPRDIVYKGGKIETFLKENTLYQNKPGMNVKFGIVGKKKTHQTNFDGTIDWRADKPYLFISKESLEKNLYEFPLVKEMKPETREMLKVDLLSNLCVYTNQVTIETREKPMNQLEVIKNCTKTLKHDYYSIRDETIYNIVRGFVDEKINSSIKTLELKVRDDLTHVPITGSNLEFETDAPSKSELLDKYFTGNLKDYSERFVLDYLIGKGVTGTPSDSIQLAVYSPSNIFLEVTNPDYNFVSGEINIRGDTKRTVYMVDKGSKVRVQKAGESEGRIE